MKVIFRTGCALVVLTAAAAAQTVQTECGLPPLPEPPVLPRFGGLGGGLIESELPRPRSSFQESSPEAASAALQDIYSTGLFGQVEPWPSLGELIPPLDLSELFPADGLALPPPTAWKSGFTGTSLRLDPMLSITSHSAIEPDRVAQIIPLPKAVYAGATMLAALFVLSLVYHRKSSSRPDDAGAGGDGLDDVS